MSLNKETTLDAVIDIIKEKLDSGGSVTFSPHGTSMLPMLRDGEDIVVLKKSAGKLRYFDLPLYQRDNGQYVLHRVIGFGKDGSYILCGDNQFAKERGITDKHVIAVMTAFYHKGKAYTDRSFRYRVYVYFWYYTRTIRRVYRAVKSRVQRAFNIQPKQK